MRALVLHEYGRRLSVQEVARPEPGPGQALVRVAACGLGLTVAHVLTGRLRAGDPKLPLIPGHEVAGTVDALGPGTSGPAPGTRVMTSFYLTCGSCRFCRMGRETLCERFRGYVGADADGGYAEYLVVPAVNALPVPESIGFVEATAIPDAIGTPYHVCVTRAQVRPGQRVLVTGAAGGVGIHMVQMARLCGAYVIAVDVDDARLEQVRQYGAHEVVNFHTIGGDARALGRPVDVAIEIVGSAQTWPFCVQALDRGGTLVNITTHREMTQVPVAPRELVTKELTVMGSRYVSRWELLRAIDLVACGSIRPVVSETCGLEGAEALFQRLHDLKLLGRGAVLPAGEGAR